MLIFVVHNIWVKIVMHYVYVIYSEEFTLINYIIHTQKKS